MEDLNQSNKKNYDLSYYAKVHSIESFGTVDGPRN